MEQVVFIVDDDAAMAEVLTTLFASIKVKVQHFSSGEDFLQAYQGQMGCLVLDVRMRGISGLHVQEQLREQGYKIPVIILTGHGDIQMAVRAMKGGAVEFLTKPFNNQTLLDAVQKALFNAEQTYQERMSVKEYFDSMQTLTKREIQVLNGIIDGKLNKVIADDLCIGVGTVEAHRSRVMKKMKVRTIAQLIGVVIKNDLLQEVAV